MLLSPLPETTERGILFRAGLGLLGGGLIFLGGLFLMRFPRELPRGEIAGATLARVAWLAVLLLFCYQYVMVACYSVDLPFYEEWEFFEPEALQRGLSLAWLFQHFGTNQQVVVPTKLMAWLDFKLFALDFVRLKLMNYAVFGCLLVWLGLFARRVAGEGERLVPCFMLFLVSPLAYEVHTASFQSGETFVMFFGTGMLWYAVTDRTSWRDTLLFALCGLLAIFSMHTGVVVAALLLVCRSLYLLSRIRCGELPGRTGYGAMALSGGVILPGIAYWLSGFGPPPAGSPPWLLPTEGKFWAQFFNLLAYGFGFDTPNVLPGIACLLLLLVPLVLLLANRETRWRPATWQVLPAILVLLALTMMITLGRGNMAGSIKLSRYTLYLSPLILFGALAWWLALRRGRKAYAVLALYWLLCAGAFLDNWHYGVYRDLQHIDILNLECVESFANGGGDGVCPETHGKPIGPFFTNARRLDISFTRQFSPLLQPK